MPEERFVRELVSPDGQWFVVFEDEQGSGHLYLCRLYGPNHYDIIDRMMVYENLLPPIHLRREVFLIWSDDSTRAGLVMDERCWGLFDTASWRKQQVTVQDGKIRTVPFSSWESGIPLEAGTSLRNSRRN